MAATLSCFLQNRDRSLRLTIALALYMLVQSIKITLAQTITTKTSKKQDTILPPILALSFPPSIHPFTYPPLPHSCALCFPHFLLPSPPSLPPSLPPLITSLSLYPFLKSGKSTPENPVKMVRSRFSALVYKVIPYLMSTTHPSHKEFVDTGNKIQRSLSCIFYFFLYRSFFYFIFNFIFNFHFIFHFIYDLSLTS